MRHPQFYLIYIVRVASLQGQRQGIPSTFQVSHPELRRRAPSLPAYADEDEQMPPLR